MTKPLIVIQGPVATRSGYGNHTRDLALALIKVDKYDIRLVSLPWGITPMNALETGNSDHDLLFDRIITAPIERQPDVFIQVSVPNEFQPVGKYNIGITAGIETTICNHTWLEGLNKMDTIIVTSEHSKEVFVKTVYDKIDEKTKQKAGESLKLTKPVEVLFEGCDTNVYYKTSDIHKNVATQISKIKEKFCYLFVGHWLQGDIGQDRKDIAMTIRTLCETFKNKASRNRPALILKTSSATFSVIDRETILTKIRQIVAPYGGTAINIYLLHGDLTDKEMNSLYNHPKIKAMVSFTKGEGFGRPLLEFTMTGKPVIASAWSGQVDFLHKEYSRLLPGKLTPVHKSAYMKDIIIEGSQWFTVDYGYAAQVLKDVHDNYKFYESLGKKQRTYSLENFTLDQMNEKFVSLVDKGLDTVPQGMQIKLPTLKKVKKAEPPKLKLPKLKKVTT